MERRLTILLIIVVYFIACSKSCLKEPAQDFRHQSEVETEKDSIRIEFETGYLSEEARFAAETRAVQKLKDFADYFSIYTDTSLDPLFRDKAGNMIRDIFISEDVKLSFGKAWNKKVKSVSLDQFLKTGFGVDIKKAELIFESIRVEEPLHKSEEEVYSGKLTAYQTIIIYPLYDSIISQSHPVTIEFISSRNEKIIGTDTLKVWEVSLIGLE